MANTISNGDDIIDSRDVIARIEELEGELEGSYVTFKDDKFASCFSEDGETNLDEEYEELKQLKALASDGEGYSDWKHGATLIRDSHFETYAEELASDIGAINSELTWPYTCIDWERAARELQSDYSSLEYDGVTYWVR